MQCSHIDHVFVPNTVKAFQFLVRENQQEQYCNKGPSVPDEKQFRIFISYDNLFIRRHSLALWEESHTTPRIDDEIVYLEPVLADKLENYKLPENSLVTLGAGEYSWRC